MSSTGQAEPLPDKAATCSCGLESLRMIRLVRRMSLKAVADRADLSAAYVQKLERGEIREPSPNKLRQLAKALDYPYPKLLRLAGYVDDEPTGSDAAQLGGGTARTLDERLGVLLDAVGDAGLTEAEAEFVASALSEYREVRAAGVAPPAEFIRSVLAEYSRIAKSGVTLAAEDITVAGAAR